MKRVIVGVAVAIAAAVIVVSISRRDAPVDAAACAAPPSALGAFQATEPRRLTPDVAFVDRSGRELTLAAFRGKGIVLNFWATWCAPCVREMPALDRLQAAMEGRGVVVLALSEDREGVPAVEPFYREHGIRHLDIHIDPRRRMLNALGVQVLPVTVLIDRQGNEIGRVAGIAEWDADEAIAFLGRCLGVA